MDDERILVRNSLTIDSEFEVIEGLSSVILEGMETEKEIGEISLLLYNSRITDLIESADGISGSQYYLISNAVKQLPQLKRNKKLMAIEEIVINNDYRSKGYGNEALKELLKFAAILSIDYIVLKPAPPNDEASEDESTRNVQIKRLITFYERFSFKTYNIPEEEPIMILDMKHFEYSYEF